LHIRLPAALLDLITLSEFLTEETVASADDKLPFRCLGHFDFLLHIQTRQRPTSEELRTFDLDISVIDFGAWTDRGSNLARGFDLEIWTHHQRSLLHPPHSHFTEYHLSKPGETSICLLVLQIDASNSSASRDRSVSPPAFNVLSNTSVIGTEAWKLTDENKSKYKLKEGDTTAWRVYVKPVPDGPNLDSWLKKVVFVLHETFPNPVRTIENPPFVLEETGYGGFFIMVKLYFQQYASEKQQQRQHYLQLEQYGDEKLMAEQKRSGMVRSETVEFIEFNEPTEQLWDALTGDAQWDYLNPGKGKGKGRSSNVPHSGERSVGLPDHAPAGSVYSKESEKHLLELLDKAMKQCEQQTAEVLKSSKDVNEQLAKLKEAEEVNARLVALHEKVPHKKK
jgi:YEATS domain-containing protein 4